MNAPRHSFPCEPSPAPIQFESVGEVLRLFSRSYELNDGEKVLSPVDLLFLQHQHEVVPEAALHHDPVHCARQVDVRGEEHDVLALQGGDGLVGLVEVSHHLVQGAGPLAGGPGAGTQVGPVLTAVLVIRLLCMGQHHIAAKHLVAAREGHCFGYFLHGQVPDVAQGTATGGTGRQFGAAVGTHQVAALALDDGRQDVVETHRTLEEGGQV